VAVALFGVVAVLLVRGGLRGTLDRALRDRARQVSQLAVSAPAVLAYPGALESAASGPQIAVEVIDARRRILARSLTLGAQLLPQDRLARDALVAGRVGFENVLIGGRQFRMYAAPIAQAGGPTAGGAVLVASDTTDISRTSAHVALVLILTGAAAALLGAIAAALLTRRGLRPLRSLALAAGEIERTADPARRLPQTGVGDEVGQLTGVLNRMLAALEAARATERRFVADASHELRTPVAALLGNVEYAVRHGAEEQIIAELQRDAARLARLVDDLLVLERSRPVVDELQPVALEEIVRAVVKEHDVDGRVRLGPLEAVQVRGDEDALARAFANLVENALVHGPAAGKVTVTLVHRDEAALLSVADEGPGPDPAYRERLFERFWRGADAARNPGSGLGLSIVAAIAERHGGQVDVAGSCFTIELPALP